MGSRSPLVGYNHNIRYNSRVYHVQTEDSGVDNPHIYTHLFFSGMIISSARTDYKDLVEQPNHEDRVRKLMQEQHKRLMKQLRQGEFDAKIIALIGSLQPEEEVAFSVELSSEAQPEASSLSPEQVQIPAPTVEVPAAPLPAIAVEEKVKPAEQPVPAEEPLPAMTPASLQPEPVEALPEAALKPAPALEPLAKEPTYELVLPEDLDQLDEMDLDDEATIRISIPTSLRPAKTPSPPPSAVGQRAPSAPRLSVRPQTLAKTAEESAPTARKDTPPQQMSLRPASTEATKPLVEVEVTEVFDMHDEAASGMAKPAVVREGTLSALDDIAPAFLQQEETDASIIVDRPPDQNETYDDAETAIRSPTFYSEVRKPRTLPGEVKPQKVEPRRPSSVFSKPVPSATFLPPAEEKSGEIGMRNRRSGVYPVLGSPPQRPPHPDPNVRRKSPSSHTAPISGEWSSPRSPTPSPPISAVPTRTGRESGILERPPWSRPPGTTGEDEPRLARASRTEPRESAVHPTRTPADSPVVTRPAIIISQPSTGRPATRTPRPPAGRSTRPAAGSYSAKRVTKPTPATPARVVKLNSPSIFGSDLITERSLDEVILSYLAEDFDTSDKGS